MDSKRLLLALGIVAILLGLGAYFMKSPAAPAAATGGGGVAGVVSYLAQPPAAIWAQDPINTYTCPGPNSLVDGYCVMATPALAETYCTGDAGCLGYLTYPDELRAVTKVPAGAVQLTATQPTSATSYGTTTFYQKTTTS